MARIDEYNECKLFVKALHSGQVDKGGSPYYHHLYEVADNAKTICDKLNISDSDFVYDCMQIGLLHDIVEDCGLSFDIICQKYGNEVANGVRLMTKTNPNNTSNPILDDNKLFDWVYIDYLTRLYQAYLDKKSYAIKAMIVKLADLTSNLNYKRLGVSIISELNNKQLNNFLKYLTTYQLLAGIIFYNALTPIDYFKDYLLSQNKVYDIEPSYIYNEILNIIDLD